VPSAAAPRLGPGDLFTEGNAMTRTICKSLAALAVLAAFGAAPARAGILPVSFTVTPEGDNFRYTYGVVLTTDAYIENGDFFTVYDFAGFIPDSAQAPEGWTFDFGVGKTPGDTTPLDDPNQSNLTWTWTGEKQSGQKGLGNFSAASRFAETDFDSFTGRTNRDVDDRIDHNITDTMVPTGNDPPPPIDPPPPTDTPEPATLALAGLGLPLLGLARALRRRKN
jgi:hypothetical protein